MDTPNIMNTPAVRAVLFKLLTHALQAPMRVNVTSERIPRHSGIKVIKVREIVKGCSQS